jgi:catechol 2,3-dioxygenase-like lactoylglutathione lyase family enzyme
MKKNNFLSLFLILICPQILAQTTTIKGIHHVSMVVQDLDSSLAFYSQTTGLQELSRPNKNLNNLNLEKKSGFTPPARQTAWLIGPNALLELITFKSKKKPSRSQLPIQGPGFTHFCYQTPQNHSIYEQAKLVGATIVSRNGVPVDRGFGIQYVYIRDKNGILFEVEQLAQAKFEEKVWLGHIAIATPDIDRLVDFYSQLLGTKPYSRADAIKNSPKLDAIANIDSLKLRGAWFRTGNMILEMWQFDNPRTPPATQETPFIQVGYQQIAFEVGNIEQEFQRLKGLGFKFLSSSPIQSETETGLFLRDPDGNLLQLFQYNSESKISLDRLKKLTW